jgi:peptidoglycan/xylan/chitin deacetylase (PgdA/CDA1 family)
VSGAQLKVAFLWTARALGLFALSRRLTRRGLRILCYHGAWMGEGRFSRYLFMSGALFARRLDHLARLRVPILPLDEAIRRLDAGTLPDCATVITIDDGWYGTCRDMVPELVKRRLPATIYLTTYYVEHQLPVFDVALQFVLGRAGARSLDLAALNPGLSGSFRLADPAEREAAGESLRRHARSLNGAGAAHLLEALCRALGFDLAAHSAPRQFHLMTAAEAAEVAHQGVDLQLHTHRHRLATDDLALLETEIADNRARLEKIAGQRQRHFCYPSGAWNEAAWPILTRLGIRSATTTAQGLNFPGAPLLGLRRLTDGDEVHELEFEAELTGFAELLRRLRGKPS